MWVCAQEVDGVSYALYVHMHHYYCAIMRIHRDCGIVYSDVCTVIRESLVCNFRGKKIVEIFSWPEAAMKIYYHEYLYMYELLR